MEFTSDGHSTNQMQTGQHDDDYQMHSTSDPISRQNSIQPSMISTQKSRRSIHDDEPMIQTTMNFSPYRESISNSTIYHVEQRYETYSRTHIDIVELIKEWQLGHISNFDYLLILNALAGRKFHDPNHHLIFPWIHDFTNSTSNLRDLSQSKYRLNKGIHLTLLILRKAFLLGDAQLDLTYTYYSTSVGTNTLIVPHHLSEHLSSITYYVYKARRTEKRILCEVGYRGIVICV